MPINHSDPHSPTHTRDTMDAGVPMQPTEPATPPQRAAPEDAFDPNARGDYSGRVDGGEHLVSEVIPEAERVPGGPISRLVPLRPRTAQIGDVPGKKGGVTT